MGRFGREDFRAEVAPGKERRPGVRDHTCDAHCEAAVELEDRERTNPGLTAVVVVRRQVRRAARPASAEVAAVGTVTLALQSLRYTVLIASPQLPATPYGRLTDFRIESRAANLDTVQGHVPTFWPRSSDHNAVPKSQDGSQGQGICASRKWETQVRHDAWRSECLERNCGE